MEIVKVRGLIRFSGWIFLVWGSVALLKGIYDLGWGRPEANVYAPTAWAFVSRPQWLRYAAFESTYGAACACLAWTLFRYSRFLPDTIRRPKRVLERTPFRP